MMPPLQRGPVVSRKYDAVFQQRRIIDSAKRVGGGGGTVASSHDPIVPSTVTPWRMRPLKMAQSFALRASAPSNQTRDLRFVSDRFLDALSPSFSGGWMRGQE
jgi:hypothetical protein